MASFLVLRFTSTRTTRFHIFMAAPRDGLHHARIDSRDEVDGRVKVFFGHARFQRPLDAPIASGLAAATHRHRQADEHLFPFGQAWRRLGPIEISTKRIGFSHGQSPILIRLRQQFLCGAPANFANTSLDVSCQVNLVAADVSRRTVLGGNDCADSRRRLRSSRPRDVERRRSSSRLVPYHRPVIFHHSIPTVSQIATFTRESRSPTRHQVRCGT